MSTGPGGTVDADVLVIGAGHNGLTCAGLLARAGHRVHVLERRDEVGGAALTQEFHPGFRNSVASYVVSLLAPEVIGELELDRFGLEILPRPGGSLSLQETGDHLYMGGDAQARRARLAARWPGDAERLPRFEARLAHVARALRPILREAPPNFGGGWGQLWPLLRQGRRLHGLGAQGQADLAELLTMSIGDYLDRWFDSPELKGLLGYEGIIGNMVSPRHPGSAFVLLHHYMGEVGGEIGAWGHARGGMGAITQAMAAFCRERGVTIETGAEVRAIHTEQGHARAVELADGRHLRARAVAGAINPKLLFCRMLDAELLPEDFRRRMEGWRCRSGTLRMNLALSRLPAFRGLDPASDPTPLTGSVDICPSLAYMETAWREAEDQGWASRPVISICLPSLLDDSLAPPGRHVASLFCQHFNPELPEGRSWDEAREAAAETVIDTLARYAPDIRDCILGRQILSPLDLERDFGLLGGDIYHGALHPDQLFSLRPAAGHADYRSPVAGLYLCAAGAHPGGGVSGLPGRNAARAMIADLGRRRRAG